MSCKRFINMSHFRRAPDSSHSHISTFDMPRTRATATFPKSSLMRLQPQRLRTWKCCCGSNLAHIETALATITLLESNVRPLCLTISNASRLPYTLFSSFPFAMCSRYHPSLPVHGLLSGLGWYRVALTIRPRDADRRIEHPGCVNVVNWWCVCVRG